MNITISRIRCKTFLYCSWSTSKTLICCTRVLIAFLQFLTLFLGNPDDKTTNKSAMRPRYEVGESRYLLNIFFWICPCLVGEGPGGARFQCSPGEGQNGLLGFSFMWFCTIAPCRLSHGHLLLGSSPEEPSLS